MALKFGFECFCKKKNDLGFVRKMLPDKTISAAQDLDALRLGQHH